MEKPRFTCAVCPNRDVCQDPCAWLEKRLPPPPAGWREETYGLLSEVMLVDAFRPPTRGGLPSLRRCLTFRERTALQLVLVENLSQAAAARRLHITRRGLRNRLLRLRKKLIRCIGPETPNSRGAAR